jgi:hypothetical protein
MERGLEFDLTTLPHKTMPTPQQLVVAGELAAELLPQISRGGETALNFLSIADRAAPTCGRVVSGLAKVEGVAGLVDAAGAPLLRAGSKIEAVSSHALSGLGAEGVAASFGDNAWTMQNRYALVTARDVYMSGGAPTLRPITFDTADDLGRIWTRAREPLAAVGQLPYRVTEPPNFGSGFAVRADGLTLAARHTVRDVAAPGDIWVKFLNQPGGSFKAGIFAESKADDLVLLKPLTPLGRPVPYVPVSAISDAVAPRSQLVSIGVQNPTICNTGVMTGELAVSRGHLLDKVPIRFPGEAATERLRTSILGSYGMSGAGTYERTSGKLTGAMLGGNDYSWSGVAKGGSIRDLILRNFHRP